MLITKSIILPGRVEEGRGYWTDGLAGGDTYANIHNIYMCINSCIYFSLLSSTELETPPTFLPDALTLAPLILTLLSLPLLDTLLGAETGRFAPAFEPMLVPVLLETAADRFVARLAA